METVNIITINMKTGPCITPVNVRFFEFGIHDGKNYAVTTHNFYHEIDKKTNSPSELRSESMLNGRGIVKKKVAVYVELVPGTYYPAIHATSADDASAFADTIGACIRRVLSVSKKVVADYLRHTPILHEYK